MKGIKSKHIRKTLKAKRLRLKSNGRYNDCDLTIRLTNITPKWKYGLRYCDGNIYKMSSWETIKVNIVVSGSMVHQSYTNVDGNETTTKSHEAITDWNERNSEWCNRSTRRQIRSWIADGDYDGRYNGDNYKWDGGIGISKLLQLFGIPSQDVKIGTIRFED
mgnify:CR=1 FL=1|jgi:hypothetical protein|tara:strand:+ start:253 stop:738 length:486 start_codon:yes stop_codon:yes gene_type:complete